MLKVGKKLFEKLLLDAGASPRKRAHHNIHRDYSESVQRLCIALKRGTYVRPHCHKDIDGWEMIMALKGEVVMLIFDSEGFVKQRFELSSENGDMGVELEPNTWHMVFPANLEAIIFEVKEGPFRPKKNCDFASWSPKENSKDVDEFLVWAKCAIAGDKFRSL